MVKQSLSLFIYKKQLETIVHLWSIVHYYHYQTELMVVMPEECHQFHGSTMCSTAGLGQHKAPSTHTTAGAPRTAWRGGDEGVYMGMGQN